VTHPTLASGRGEFGGRVYRIPGRKDKYGKQLQYPSVTTVLKVIDKPGISQWIADETAAYAVANLMYLEQHTEEYGWRYLRHYWHRTPDLQASELRLHHEGVKNDAAELGTNIHEWIEAELGLEGKTYPEVLALEVDEMIEAFDRWAVLHDIEPRWAERTVVHDELGYAGTGDAHWYMRCTHADPCLPDDGWYDVLIDVKSSRYTWPEHGMQLAALANAPVIMRQVPTGTPGARKHEKTENGTRRVSWWVEEPRPKYDRVALLHIRPNDLDPHGRKIPAFCELEDRTDDLDLYWQAFQGALSITYATHGLRRRLKARGAFDVYDQYELESTNG
jgi:hypothetical protein